MHTVRSPRRGPNGKRRWLAKAGIGAFAIIGGTAALAVPATAAQQSDQFAARSLAIAPYAADQLDGTIAYPGTAEASAGTVTVTLASAKTSAVGSRVLTEALRHRGAPYRYGATGPYRFDCSGFTLYVYRKFGVSLPHKARMQRLRGRGVSRAQARPGDLVVFRQGGSWGHVAIYVGNGYIIDAPHSGARVAVRKLWTRDVVFRRLVG